jgi:hypothetical protein
MAMDTTVVNPTIHVMKVLLRIGNLDPWFRWFNAHADAEMNVPVAVSAAVPLRNFITIDENYAPIYHIVQEVSALGGVLPRLPRRHIHARDEIARRGARWQRCHDL